ncbi:hypothetical protein GCM10027284_16290 [Cyclobacterium sediminis]
MVPETIKNAMVTVVNSKAKTIMTGGFCNLKTLIIAGIKAAIPGINPTATKISVSNAPPPCPSMAEENRLRLW